jgi:membrane-associated protease RseP (regulator of RpoE activity)
MTHRVLLCLVFFSLLSVAQSEELRHDTTGENWNLGYSSDETGSGSSYMGVDIADVTSERLGDLKLKEEHGAEITMVDQDAPAGKAGLREHDVILTLNGTAVESAAQLRRMIKEIPPGRVVTLGVSRDGQPLAIKLQLADRRKSMAYKPSVPEFNFKMPEMPVIPDFEGPISVVVTHSSVRSGLMVENITPQLGEFFGVKNGKGVLVRSVEKGSKAEKAGFRAGDVVVKVNDQTVRDTSDFTHALRSSSGASAAVTVVREKKNLNLALPTKKDSGSLIEDSFDIDLPELTAETEVQLGLGDEMARVRPALERVQRQIESKDFQEKLRDSQRKMQELQEKVSHELCGEWAEL